MRVGTLDAELEPLLLSKAAQHGLDPSWVTRLARLDPHRPQVPMLARQIVSTQGMLSWGCFSQDNDQENGQSCILC